MTYFKPWTSYAEQIDTLIARGLHVADRALALDYLERIGYYTPAPAVSCCCA